MLLTDSTATTSTTRCPHERLVVECSTPSDLCLRWYPVLNMGSVLHLGPRLLAVMITLPAVLLVAQPAQSAQTAPTSAPAVTLIEPAAPLLPEQIGPWRSIGSTPAGNSYTPQGSEAEILHEDDLLRSSEQTYKRPDSPAALKVAAFQFVDATAAYSAYTSLETPQMHALPLTRNVARQSAIGLDGEVLLLEGTTVARVQPSSSTALHLEDLRSLVVGLPKIGGPKGQPPLLPTLLPAKGLISDSVRYALGPATYKVMGGRLPSEMLGFDKSAEVITASYSHGGLLTLLLYPTPQIAGEHGRQLEAEMNREGAGAGTVKLRREGPLLLLTTGNWKPDEAQRLIENIHLHDEVTWDKKMPLEFHAEVQKTASLLYSIAMLSIVLMLAAVVLGLFFGGGRALIRVLQGKPAATEPEFLRIDLRDRPGEGGSFKPLQ